MREGEGSGQHGEDRILALVFGAQPSGFLVDVGAADGFWNSNSIGLLKRPGWSAILIEPELEQFQILRRRYKERPRTVCTHCAIGKHEGVCTLFAGGQVSTFKQEIKRSAEVNHNVRYTEQQVQVWTLTHLLNELECPQNIDFMSIDAEGMNYEVWQTLDTKAFSPRLVCIEGKGYRMDGYKELCRLGGNTFYLREDACPKL
jgi:FkbM family methyltransferase